MAAVAAAIARRRPSLGRGAAGEDDELVQSLCARLCSALLSHAASDDAHAGSVTGACGRTSELSIAKVDIIALERASRLPDPGAVAGNPKQEACVQILLETVANRYGWRNQRGGTSRPARPHSP